MKTETIFLDLDQARDLVDRIATRAMRFEYEMSKPEMEAMAQLLSDIGVKVDDLIDVSNLADNYAINAEIVSDSDIYKPSPTDYLFGWSHDGENYYCLTW